MLSEYEYAQAVMAAAGVEPRCALCACGHEKATHGPNGVCLAIHADYSGCSDFVEARKLYPDPLTSGDAFLALIEALAAKGWRVDFSSNYSSDLCRVETSCTIFTSLCKDRRVALVEAAGHALGVTR